MALVLGHGLICYPRIVGPSMYSMRWYQARAKSTSKVALLFDREIARTGTTDLSAS